MNLVEYSNVFWHWSFGIRHFSAPVPEIIPNLPTGAVSSRARDPADPGIPRDPPAMRLRCWRSRNHQDTGQTYLDITVEQPLSSGKNSTSYKTCLFRLVQCFNSGCFPVGRFALVRRSD